MKRLLRTIGEHARRHRERLSAEDAATGYSEAQAGRIRARVDAMLAHLPTVIYQAHERIIGERPVPNAQKILSVHEPDLHVIVRGKAGREGEFGNTLFVAESEQGLILDWELYQETAPAVWRQLQESLERQAECDLPDDFAAACGDRGFHSRVGLRQLRAADIDDATCPRDPVVLRERFRELADQRKEAAAA